MSRTDRRRTAGAVGARRLPHAQGGPLNRSPSAGCGERLGDRGSVTVWATGGIAVVMAVTTGLLWLASAVVTRHRAESAADLAALAAASTAVAGERQACGQARWVAENMGVRLLTCRLSGWDALVEVVAVPPGVLSHLGSAVARARAGPVESGS
jgi:secretion/DNA translocation related TadE-like protein